VVRSRRGFLCAAGCGALGLAARAQRREFDVTGFGAVGDGVTLDTAALQQAIDQAATVSGGSRVLLRGGKRYLTGALQLKCGIDFHLADDAQLIASPNAADYPSAHAGLLMAEGAAGLKISGTGNIDGQAMKFMTSYSDKDQRWEPQSFRPRMFSMVRCQDLEVREITFRHAPEWGLHMLGCERVLVDGIKIRNHLDVPNCDGIDPDHCRDVEIRNCDIVCGDDAIVVKSTRQGTSYGACSNITVRDCVMETKDSGLKIGTETTDDIHDIHFERCEIRSCCRGLTIQLRDEGNVYNVDFNDIRFVSRYQAAPWWGRGEAISLTSFPRSAGMKVGKIHDVRIANVLLRPAELSAGR